MRLLFIRHAEPDYTIDSLTEKGFREASLLRDRLVKLNIRYFYCSPLGRARDTAKPTLEAYGKSAEICDFLREFNGHAVNPETGEERGPWDLLPAFVAKDDRYFDKTAWLGTPYFGSGTVKEKYDGVCRGIDDILARHGYIHDGAFFRVEKENTDTLAFFCHFAVECVILSHLLHMSPVPLWQGFVALSSSVTTLNTEEREQGIASLRCSGFGDLSHLYAADEPASFAARFCEVYSNFDERH